MNRGEVPELESDARRCRGMYKDGSLLGLEPVGAVVVLGEDCESDRSCR